MSLMDKLVNLDRRVIFVAIFLSVLIPVLMKLTFPEFATKMTEEIYEEIEALPPGSKILFSMDYDPPSEPELKPMTVALLRQMMTKGHDVYFMTLWAPGQQLIAQIIDEIINKEFPEKKYGVDYVNLGYKAGGPGVIAVIVSNLEKLFPSDVSNTPLRNIPMMNGVASLRDFDAIVSVGGGWPGLPEWVQFGTDPIGKRLITGTTAVSAPLYLPYYPRQLVGMLGGIKGAAEYESLIMKNYPRFADPAMHMGIIRWGPQTIAHLVIVAFIIIGNIIFFASRGKKKS